MTIFVAAMLLFFQDHSIQRESLSDLIEKSKAEDLPNLFFAVADQEKISDDDILTLVEQLGDDRNGLSYRASPDDTTVGRFAADALQMIGKQAVPELNRSLSDPKQHAIRRRVLELVGDIGIRSSTTQKAIDGLFEKEIKSDEDSALLTRAIYALGRTAVNKADAIKRISSVSSDASSEEVWAVRKQVATELGLIGKDSEKAIETLLQLLKDKEFWVQKEAISSLEKIGEGNAQVVEGLKGLAKTTKYEFLKQAVEIALSNMKKSSSKTKGAQTKD